MFKDKEKVIGVLDSAVSIIGIGLIGYGTYLIYISLHPSSYWDAFYFYQHFSKGVREGD